MEAVVFDMDGVLFDTERLCMESWREIAAEKGIENIEPAVLGCIGLNRNDTIQFFKDHYGEDFDFEDFRIGYSERMEQKLKEGGLPVKPGVRELLRYLEEKKIPMAVASSTRRDRVLGHLEESGIQNYFQVVIGGDQVLHSKPEPDIYLLACESLSVSPEKSFAIEDSINGIRSAFRAGMQVIMVPDMIAPTPEAIEKTAVIKDSLTEVLNWFQESKAFA